MKTITTLLGCVGLTLVMAGPTYAQKLAATSTDTTTTMPSPSSENAPNGSLQRYHDMFRASKLVGANVYNQSGQTIGSVDDLLVGSDGKVSEAVVSVGGFLGIGGKLVAVPFTDFKFVESRKSTADNTASPMLANPTSSTGTTPATTTPTATTTAPMKTSSANEPVYYSIVLPTATKNSLSSAAEFKYES